MTAMPTTGLWIVPDPWNTPRTRVPQVLGRRQERAAHNAPQALILMGLYEPDKSQ